ncbi:MAG TPA: hypothetical protein P5277_03270 [Candidatus Paceibacterota bacterium]|nr:hypothetical protein [Candidatus Paceibacterota bacterium]
MEVIDESNSENFKRSKIKSARKIYVTISIILLNTIILFLLINLILYFVNPVLRQMFVVGELTFSDEIISEIYPHMSLEDSRSLILETHKKIFHVYEPFTGFKVGEFNGTFIHVDKEGFRFIKDQCSYPPSNQTYNLFILGGSTTFGSGVIDNETIASKIQEILRKESSINKTSKICIYNFGRPFYYSSQERELFTLLLLEENQRPNVVIFIDGLNEHIKEVRNNQRMSIFMLGNGKISYLISDLPITEDLNYLINKFNKNMSSLVEENSTKILYRYLENKKFISEVAKSYNITTYFVIHPLPAYNYSCSSHFLCKRGIESFSHIGWNKTIQFYTDISKIYKSENIIWLGDIQAGRTENFYIDYGHFNANFSEEIAREIIQKTNLTKDIKLFN